MAKVLDVLLMPALPASGRSEVRRYFSELPPELCREQLHLGPIVPLADYSYVHMMRRVGAELRAMGRDGVFFDGDHLPNKEPRDVLTLTALLDMDYHDVVDRHITEPESATGWLLDRYDAARAKCGIDPAMGTLPQEVREALVDALEPEAQELLMLKNGLIPDSLDGRTVVIELGRGGPRNAGVPLPSPHGYGHALRCFSDDLLTRASILYVWVTVEQSHLNAMARTSGPGSDQSTLHHGMPVEVLRYHYGVDDLEHLLRSSGKPDTIEVEAHGKTYLIPATRFDNRDDKTSFMRESKSAWTPEKMKALHGEVAAATQRLVAAGARMKG
jgi:hypothetical protein